MSKSVRQFLIAVVALLAVAATPRAFQAGSGQPQAGATSATLQGVVKDKDGAVPGATVVVKLVATGETLAPIVTNEKGLWSWPGLRPAAYSVTITMAGYKTVQIAVLALNAGNTMTINTTLEPGKREEVVNVSVESGIRADTPTISQPVSADFIQTLPRNDRNAVSFLVFLPGVTTAGSASGDRFNTTIAGLPANQMNITIDGITQNNQLQATDGFFSKIYPRLDAIEEVSLRSYAQERGLTGETYSRFNPNSFLTTLDHPLSTFGADVDTASYTNVRRILSSGQLPPAEAVRLEEFVNYFHFGYAAPRDGRPIALTTEVGDCPWAPTHKLVLIGARAMAPPAREITGRNIVLLIDVSGSMEPAERLPLIKTALSLFVDTLKPTDTLAIVTYAGSSGLVLPPTSIRYRDTIQSAISGLTAGGSTNGGEGLMLAYRVASQAFIKGGVNRVILATDGDFNVGVTSQQELLTLIERERQYGVFLSVFGVGSGNLKDATMEMLADHGNGHYAYLDSLQEARRVLIREADATLDTVAKDVKFQVEFNPATVLAWKQLGYENRAMAAQDFNNDRKDSGDMGGGHTVTALYEVVLVGDDLDVRVSDGGRPLIDPLKYQPGPVESLSVRPATRPAATRGELLTVKTRYKMPDSDTSELISQAVRDGEGVRFLPMASAVAEFALLLRDAPRDRERGVALARRVDRLQAVTADAAELDNFRELFATARGLARIK